MAREAWATRQGGAFTILRVLSSPGVPQVSHWAGLAPARGICFGLPGTWRVPGRTTSWEQSRKLPDGLRERAHGRPTGRGRPCKDLKSAIPEEMGTDPITGTSERGTDPRTGF